MLEVTFLEFLEIKEPKCLKKNIKYMYKNSVYKFNKSKFLKKEEEDY